ncbi:hypothetical protein LX97_00445 [Nonlabens dokdonensis]|uniref:Transmembrane protein n=1 Tax=Nonlabens dokdonensis TaxID=328515 RepID=A0ABX5Q064_9FLAO|nr:hypothetical protein LX97_00445 [Nonlabens dokdonensis]
MKKHLKIELVNTTELEFFIATWGTAFVILIVVCLLAKVLGKNPLSRHKWLVIPALVLAIYCILTSWIWIYYMIVFICLPFFLASVVLAYLGYRAYGTTRLLKITLWLQGAALFIAFVCFVLLLLFD